MSYSQAHKVAQIVTYAKAVEAAQQATFYNDLSWFQAVAAQENTIPAAWMPTAICEEGGRNDSYAGYFGILGGTTSMATRLPAVRRLRCSWPGKQPTAKGRPMVPGSATAIRPAA